MENFDWIGPFVLVCLVVAIAAVFALGWLAVAVYRAFF